jgi:competence protein ComEA
MSGFVRAPAGMDSMTPAPPPAANAPAPPTAWPRPAQLATAALLALAAALLTVHALGSWRGSRPTDLRPGAAPLHPIDLNQAGRAELLQLPGVGAHLAERIEDQRRRQGGFRSVEDLRQVPGIGATTLERLRPWVCVRDGEAEEESEPPAEPAPPPRKAAAPARPAVPAKTAKLTGPVDVNRATADELQKLPGIGPKLAQRILDERGRARFKSVDDLRRVAGIGAKTLEHLRPYVTVDGTPVHVATAADGEAALSSGLDSPGGPR